MFYDFNRHKRPDEPEKKLAKYQRFQVRLQNLMARIPEKIKIPVLILLISITGLGFFRLIVDGTTLSDWPQFEIERPQQFYYRSPQTLGTYLDSLEQGHILDSLSQSSQEK